MTLDPLAQRVLDLVRDAALAGQACPSNEQLAAAIDCSRNAARDGLKRVEAAGLVRVKRGVRARVVEDAAGAWRTRGHLIEVAPGVLSGTWGGERDARLRALWASGLSCAEIAYKMGLSKNAVVGRAHRLQLPARPSPISRDGAPAAPRIPRAPRATLPPPGVIPGPVNRVAPSDPAVGSGRIQPAEGRSPLAAVEPRVAPSAPAPASGQPSRLAPATRAASPHLTCQWIEGEPAGAETAFCGQPVGKRLDGGRSSFCAAHHARCWHLSLRHVPQLGRAA